jgi:hypothetical protein
LRSSPGALTWALSAGGELEDLIHLYPLDRAILLTSLHNTALTSPVTTGSDVDLHHRGFAAVVAGPLGG